MSKRIAWIDIARGIGIILVVYGHVLRGLNHSGIMPAGSILARSDYSIYTFHMPLFFLLAGLNVKRSLQKGLAAFFKSKLWTIAYPYFLWSIIQGSVEIALASHLNNPVTPHDLRSILWAPIKQFWFFYFLFIFHAIAAFTATRPRLFLLLTGATVGITFFVNWPNQWYHSYAYMFLFYQAGVIFDAQILAGVGRLKAISVPVLAALYLIAVHYGGRASAGDVVSAYSLPGAFLGIALTLAFSNVLCEGSQTLTKVFAAIGVASTAIYILHVLAAAGVRVLLKAVHVYNFSLQLVVGVLCGVVLPMIAYWVAVRFGVVGIVGLGVQPRRVNGPDEPSGDLAPVASPGIAG